MNQRLFNSPYFRSIDALLLLASYRAAALLQWLPWLSLMIVMKTVGTSLQRLIKAKEFRQHNPELVALYACLGIITVRATVLVFEAPVSWHPLVMPLLPLGVGFWGSRAWGLIIGEVEAHLRQSLRNHSLSHTQSIGQKSDPVKMTPVWTFEFQPPLSVHIS